eukprot:COSAG02_NODE_6909_length_3297_cov_3.780350_2_plen_124_part_00
MGYYSQSAHVHVPVGILHVFMVYRPYWYKLQRKIVNTRVRSLCVVSHVGRLVRIPPSVITCAPCCRVYATHWVYAVVPRVYTVQYGTPLILDILVQRDFGLREGLTAVVEHLRTPDRRTAETS